MSALLKYFNIELIILFNRYVYINKYMKYIVIYTIINVLPNSNKIK